MPRRAVLLPPMPGWHVVRPGQDVEKWIDAVVGQAPRPERVASSLREDLRNFLAHGDVADRTRVAVIHPHPALARQVIAAGWIHVGPEADPHKIADEVRSAPLPPHVLSRDVAIRESRRAPGVTVHDLLTDPRRRTDAELYERCAALVHHRSLGIAFRVELSTADLAAFDDLAATCLAYATEVVAAEAEGVRA